MRLRGCVRLADVKSNKRYAFAKKLDTPGKALTIQHVDHSMILLRRISTDRVAESLAYYLQLTGDVNSINSLFSVYEVITPEDICQTVAKYFAPSNRYVDTTPVSFTTAATFFCF